MLFVAASHGSPTPQVQVRYSHSTLQVRIPPGSDLRSVLSTICRQARAQCQLDALPQGLPVAPLSLAGSWEDVVSQLLDGTGVNYAALTGGEGQEPILLVSAKPPQSAFSAVAAQGAVPAGADAGPASPTATAPPVDLAANAEDANVSQSSAPSAQAPDGATAGMYPDAQGHAVYAPFDPNAPRTMMYADGSGNVAPAPPLDSNRTLPYPDGHGNAIPAPPVSPIQTFIYPDGHGHAVPLPQHF